MTELAAVKEQHSKLESQNSKVKVSKKVGEIILIHVASFASPLPANECYGTQMFDPTAKGREV